MTDNQNYTTNSLEYYISMDLISTLHDPKPQHYCISDSTGRVVDSGFLYPITLTDRHPVTLEKLDGE